MIAAAKMKKAQDKVTDGREYSKKLNGILSNVYESNPEIFSNSESNTTETNLILLITPDRGLCGALVSNILREANKYINGTVSANTEILVIGKKGNSFILKSENDVSELFKISDMPTFEEVSQITKPIIEKYKKGDFSQLNVIYSEFISTAVQKPITSKLFPIEIINSDEASASVDFLYEPDMETVSKALIPRYIEMNIFNAILNAVASEHSARLVAMQNATDNATELKEDLTLDLNKARQQTVTSEILDIIGGALALEE
jgi:F-type H+-transporting ATPase subunit gamma